MHLIKAGLIVAMSVTMGLGSSASSAYAARINNGARIVKKDGKYYGYRNGVKLKGWNVVGNKLYYFNGSHHAAVTSKTVRSVHLLSNGVAANTLDAELNKKVTTILRNYGATNSSKSKKLRVLWNYLTTRAHFHYFSKYPNMSTSSWAKDYASWMLDHHSGNCYGFACTFAAMAYVAGYNPTIVTGRVHGSRDHARDGYTRHAAVRINGRWYDPEGQCAGWLRGVYGRGYYPTSFISKSYHSYARQNGNKKDITISGKGQYYYYSSNGYYYGFDNKNHPLTGYYYFDDKIFNFDEDHRMKIDTQKKLQKQIAYKTPFAAIQQQLGDDVKREDTGAGCSGIDGNEIIYSYDHLLVNTIVPADGSDEIILSITGK